MVRHTGFVNHKKKFITHVKESCAEILAQIKKKANQKIILDF
jgi:hypothetical protein